MIFISKALYHLWCESLVSRIDKPAWNSGNTHTKSNYRYRLHKMEALDTNYLGLHAVYSSRSTVNFICFVYRVVYIYYVHVHTKWYSLQWGIHFLLSFEMYSLWIWILDFDIVSLKEHSLNLENESTMCPRFGRNVFEQVSHKPSFVSVTRMASIIKYIGRNHHWLMPLPLINVPTPTQMCPIKSLFR